MLNPLLNTHFISEFTTSKMKLQVLSPVEESEEPKPWGKCSEEAQKGPWDGGTVHSCPGAPRGHSSCCGTRAAHIHTGWNFHGPPLQEAVPGICKGKMIRFYYKHSPGTPLTATKSEILSCHHLPLNGSWEPHSGCTEWADFQKKKERKP